MTWRSTSSGHVIGCHVSQETKVLNACHRGGQYLPGPIIDADEVEVEKAQAQLVAQRERQLLYEGVGGRGDHGQVGGVGGPRRLQLGHERRVRVFLQLGSGR